MQNYIFALLAVLLAAVVIPNLKRENSENSGGDMSKDSKSDKDKYSILLPTYNEVENLPIIVWLIVKYMEKRWGSFKVKTVFKS